MASDNINQVGKYVKQTRKKADYALKRYKPDVPRIERIRDVFDPANEFSMTFDIRPGEDTVLLDLSFNKPPPTGGCNSDCTVSNCEQFDLGAGTHFITLEHGYDQGSLRIYDNLIAVEPSKIDETDRAAGQLSVQEITGTGPVIVCYTYSDPGCDFPDVFPTCPELDAMHASQHVGLASIFMDRFDRSMVDSQNSHKETTGGCGYWTGTVSVSSSSTTAGAFISNATAHFENDRVAGDQWEIVQAGEIFNSHPSLQISTAGATGFGVSVGYNYLTHKFSLGASYRYHFQQGDGFGGLLPGDENKRVGFDFYTKEFTNFKIENWFTTGVTSVKYFMRLSSVNPGGFYFKIWKQDEPEPTFFDIELTIFDVPAVFNQFDREMAFGGILNATFIPGGGLVQAIVIWGTQGYGHGIEITGAPYDGINGWTLNWCRAAPMDGFTRFGFCPPPGTPSTVTVVQGGGSPSDTAWFSWPSFVEGPGLVESGSSNTLRQGFIGKPQFVRIKGQVRASTFVDRSWGVTFQQYGFGEPSRSGERFSGTTIGGVTTGGNDSWTDFDIIAQTTYGDDESVRYVHWGALLTNSPDTIVGTLPRYEPPFLFANNAPIQVSVRDIEYLPFGQLDCTTGNFCPDNPEDFDLRCGTLLNAGINLPAFCNPIGQFTSHEEDEVVSNGDGNDVWIERSQGIDISTSLGETTIFWRQAGITDDMSDGRCRRQSTQTLNGVTTAGDANVWIKMPTPGSCAIHTDTYLELYMPKIPDIWTDINSSNEWPPNLEIDIGGQDGGPLIEIFQYWTGSAASPVYHQDLDFVSAGDNNTYPGPLGLNAWTAIRMTTEGGRFKVKFWPIGQSEPSTWSYDLPGGNNSSILSFGFFIDVGNYPDDSVVIKYRNLTSTATNEIPPGYGTIGGGIGGGTGGGPGPQPPQPPPGSGSGSPGSGSGSGGGSGNSPLPPAPVPNPIPPPPTAPPTTPPTVPPVTNPPTNTTTPDWYDLFNGDRGQWNSVDHTWAADFVTDSAYAVVTGGNLEIREEKIGSIYYSGMLRTNRTFDHGYFEAVMKWPQGTAFDCAFWLRCPDSVSAPRPELDIIEAYPNVPFQYPGVNRYQATFHYVSGGNLFNHQVTYDGGHDLTNTWHTVACEWIPGSKIVFYFDGAAIGTFTSDAIGPNNPMNIVFSIGVGTFSAAIDGTTPLAATMYIDSVKWWSVKPPAIPPPPPPPPPPPAPLPLPPPPTGTIGSTGPYTPSGSISITTSNTVIEGKSFSAPESNGGFGARSIFISAHGTAASPINNITIRNCTFFGGTIAIWLQHCTNVLVENCTIRNADYCGIMFWSVIGGTVRNNDVQKIGYNRTDFTDGAFLNNAYGIMLNRNEGPSLTIDPHTQNVVVDHNIVRDVPLWMCLNGHGGVNNTFSNNICSGAPRAIFNAGSPPGFQPSGIKIINNNVSGPVTKPGGSTNVVGILYASWTGGQITGNTISSAFEDKITDYQGQSVNVIVSGNVIV